MVNGPALSSFPQLKFSSGGGTGGGTLNFHQLYIFYAVASHRSFSRAAESLSITQPAVSIQVQELEKFLGAALFHRRTRGLRITEVGETVFAYAQQIFSLSGKLLETLEEIHNLQTGRLALGASTTPGEYLLPQAVGRFRQLYPGISVELSIANTQAITQRILNQELDLGMVGRHPTVGQDELGIIDYMDDEIVLVAAPTHPLAQQEKVTAAQVAETGPNPAGARVRHPEHGRGDFWRDGPEAGRCLEPGQQRGPEAGCHGWWRCCCYFQHGCNSRNPRRNAGHFARGGLGLPPAPDPDLPQGTATLSQQTGFPGVPDGRTSCPANLSAFPRMKGDSDQCLY